MNIAAFLILGGIFSGILLLTAASWSYSFAAFFARRPLPLELEPQDRPPTERGLVDVLVNMLIYALFSWVTISALYALGLVKPQGQGEPIGSNLRPIQFLALGGAQLFAVMLGTLFVCLRAQIGVGQFGWDLRFWRKDLTLALYGFGLIIVPVFVIQGVLSQVIEYEHPAMTPFKTNKSWTFFTSAFFSAVIVAPIAEEFFFRGVLQAWLQRLSLFGAKNFGELLAPPAMTTPATALESPQPSEPLSPASPSPFVSPLEAPPAPIDANPYASPFMTSSSLAPSAAGGPSRLTPQWPVWVTSAIFALLHMGQGAAPAPLFFFSLMLGYVYRKTGRLFPVVVMHLLLNGISMAGLALSTIVQPDSV